MKSRALATMLVVAGLLLTGAVVAAAKPTFESTISYTGPFFGEPFHGVMTGRVDSPKHACIAGRTVKLFLDDGGGTLALADTDRTSDRGVWAAEAPTFTVGKVTVLKRQIGKRGHRIVCKGASLILD